MSRRFVTLALISILGCAPLLVGCSEEGGDSGDSSTPNESGDPGDPGEGDLADDFDGDGPLNGYTTNNQSALPDVARADDRYRANLADNTANVTLHFNDSQGRLDSKLLSFPFDGG